MKRMVTLILLSLSFALPARAEGLGPPPALLNSIARQESGLNPLAINVEWYSSPSRQIAVTFHDTGPGFPADKLDQLMDPFFTTKDDGTGLGLPIVGNILTGHNATMELDNDPIDGGARVRVTLPEQ